MNLHHDALVLVADGQKYLLLRNSGDFRNPLLKVEASAERRGAPICEIEKTMYSCGRQRWGAALTFRVRSRVFFAIKNNHNVSERCGSVPEPFVRLTANVVRGRV